MADRFQLWKALTFGTIPSIYFSSDPWDDLKSYVSDYLKEEIVAEAVTRDLGSFSRFLEIAAGLNGSILNYDKIASLSQVKRSTVQNYYQILRDTLIGRDLPAFTKSKDVKAIKTSKFYFFDIGVVHYLKGQREIFENSTEFGYALESYLHHEILAFCDYQQGGHTLSFWRSVAGAEVDFLIDNQIAIEVKSTKHVIGEDLKGLLALKKSTALKKAILVCQERHQRVVEGILIMPVELFLNKLWAGEI